MKDYSEVIQIYMPVNQIAKKLLESFDEKCEHKEILTEIIINYGLDNMEMLHKIYNTLNGVNKPFNPFAFFIVPENKIEITQDVRITCESYNLELDNVKKL